MTTEKTVQEIHQIKLDELADPIYYLERDDDAAAIAELAKSIQEIGLINPITVRRMPDGYRIVTGAHRFRAAQVLKWETIAAIIIRCKKIEELTFTLAENITRTDLNPVTVAFIIAEIQQEQELTQYEIAEKFGKSQAWVAAKLKLLTSTPELLDKIGTGEISESVAAEVLRLEDDAVLAQAMDKIDKRGMTVQSTREMIKDYQETGSLEPERLRQEEMIQQEETPGIFMTECAVDHHEVAIAEVVVVRLCKEHYEMIRKMLQVQQLDFFRL